MMQVRVVIEGQVRQGLFQKDTIQHAQNLVKICDIQESKFAKIFDCVLKVQME
jgi:hypothetical protein